MDGVRDSSLYEAMRLLSYPPELRKGIQQLLKPNAPAAGNSFIYKISGDFWERLVTVSFTFATSAAAGNRSLSLSFTDGDGYIFNQTQIAADIGPSSTVSEYGDLISTIPIQGDGSIVGEGSVTTPAAGATIAQITGVPAGTYNVTAVVALAGTVAQAVDANNLQITSTGAPATIALDNTIATGSQVFGPYEVTVPAGGTIAVKSIILATTGAIYSAQITATPVTQSGSFTYPDLTLEPGWQIQIAVANIQAADQLSGIGLFLERYSSKYGRGGYVAEEQAYRRELLERLAGL